MSDKLRVVFVATFADDESAKAALLELRRARAVNQVEFQQSALVARDDDGKLTIKDDDLGAVDGAARGGVIGGLVGLVLGPVALATAAIGAAIGAVAEKLHDGGFPNDRLEALGAALKANRGAVVVSVGADDAPGVRTVLEQTGARHIEDGLNETLIREIMAGNA